MQEFAKQFYSSKPWQECRAAYRKSVGGLCEVCLSKGLYVPGDIVHHKVHLNRHNIHDPNVTLNWNNLQLVCRDCHARLHGKDKRYTFDQYGRLVIL